MGESSSSAGPSRVRGKWISTGDEGMDRCLGGGLRRGCLYEITGESAAGKSHLALTLALSAQIPSLASSPGGALILTSERELSTDRLVQLANSLLATHDPHPHPPHREGNRVKDLLDNVLTNRIADVDALEHALMYAIPGLLEARKRAAAAAKRERAMVNGLAPENVTRGRSHSASSSTSTTTTTGTTTTSTSRHPRSALNGDGDVKPIRLIVLDSITALFRGGSSAVDEKPTAPSSLSLTERSKRLCGVADQLKALAVAYDLVVVVINQVSDVFTRQRITPSSTPTSSFVNATQREPYAPPGGQHYGAGVEGESGQEPPMLYASQARWFSGQSDGLNKEASLGIVWANAVNVRIMLSRTGRRRLLRQDDLRPVKRRKREDTGDNEVNTRHVDGKASTGVDEAQGGLNGLEADDIKPTLIRRMHVVFCPFSASSTIDYAITENGLFTIPDSYKAIDIVDKVRKRREAETKVRAREMEEQRRDLGMGSVTAEARAEEEEGDGEDGDEDELQDVFDDFGELPAEFWAEYEFGQGQGDVAGLVRGAPSAGAVGDNSGVEMVV